MKAAYPDVKGPGDILPPVGVANAYDAMHLTALAITNAGSVEGAKIREGFYAIDTYDGLIKTYKKPFSLEQHDALTENDYIMVHYVGNQIEPVA
jgi:branched-chain amino acid transport system substrate-binding protein